MNVALISVIVIAVILILGLVIGWNFFFSNNIDTIVNQCATACDTNSKYDYCTKIRTVKDGQIEIETNCATFSVISAYEKYGIEECSLIRCNFECTNIIDNGIVKKECTTNEDDVTSIADIVSGQKCCVPKFIS